MSATTQMVTRSGNKTNFFRENVKQYLDELKKLNINYDDDTFLNKISEIFIYINNNIYTYSTYYIQKYKNTLLLQYNLNGFCNLLLTIHMKTLSFPMDIHNFKVKNVNNPKLKKLYRHFEKTRNIIYGILVKINQDYPSYINKSIVLYIQTVNVYAVHHPINY